MVNQYSSLEGLMSTASAAVAIAKDPYLPEVTSLVLRLQSMESGSGSGGQGVGLRNVVGPLRTYVKVQEKPWLLPLVLVGVAGGLFALGYYTRGAK